MTQYPIEIDDDDTTTNVREPVVITPEIRALARRPYAVVVVYEEDSGWVGRVPEILGTLAVGDTLDEMMAALDEVKELWIAVMLRDGEPIPDPRPMEEIINPALHPAYAPEVAAAAADGN